MKIIGSLFLFLFILGGMLSASEGKRRVREFRPLTQGSAVSSEPTSTKTIIARPIDPTAIVDVVSKKQDDPQADSKRATGLGWQYYDRQMWEPSKKWFLTALEWDTSNRKAAEGLLMTVYHGHSARDAYDLGIEFSSAMPGVNEMVTGAVSDEAKRLIESGETGKARALLDQFPMEEKDLLSARRMLEAGEPKVKGKQDPAEMEVAPQKELPSAVEYIKQVRRNEKNSVLGRGPGEKRKETLYASAREAHLEERYRTSLWYIDEAEKHGTLDAGTRNLKGWNLYSTGRYEEASEIFEGLYRDDCENRAAAHGLYLSLTDFGAADYLFDIQTELGGALSQYSLSDPEKLVVVQGSGCEFSEPSLESDPQFEFAGLLPSRVALK